MPPPSPPPGQQPQPQQQYQKVERALRQASELDGRRAQIEAMLAAMTPTPTTKNVPRAFLQIEGHDAQPLVVPRIQARNLLQAELQQLDLEIAKLRKVLDTAEAGLT